MTGILVVNEHMFDCTDTNIQEENIANICCGRKRIRLQCNEHANDRSVWNEILECGTPGR